MWTGRHKEFRQHLDAANTGIVSGRTTVVSQLEEHEMRVLIADGDEGFLEILQCYLWDRGHEAETAGDGLECLTILEEFKPEIVLLERELLWTSSLLQPFGSRNGVREDLERYPFWSGSQGVLTHMQSTPAFSETSVIMMAGGWPWMILTRYRILRWLDG